LAAMEWEDKVRACYQHACLRFVCREVMTNASLRTRFGIDETNAAIASRIIKRTIKAGLVRAKDPTSSSRKHTAYVPFWACILFAAYLIVNHMRASLALVTY